MPRSLSPAEIDKLLHNAASFRSKIIVSAERVTAETQWATAHGDSLQAKVGDWWLSDGDDRWSVDAEVFAHTYEHVDGNRYRKTAQIVATRLDGAVQVSTLEGSSTGQPGDWLARNPTGECWPIPAAVFARRYEEA